MRCGELLVGQARAGQVFQRRADRLEDRTFAGRLPVRAGAAREARQVQPIIGAMDSTAAHSDGCSLRCSRTRRTARSRTSGENLVCLLMGSILSKSGASTKPGAVHKFIDGEPKANTGKVSSLDHLV